MDLFIIPTTTYSKLLMAGSPLIFNLLQYPQIEPIFSVKEYNSRSASYSGSVFHTPLLLKSSTAGSPGSPGSGFPSPFKST